MFGIALLAQITVVASAPPTAVSCTPFEISVAARAPGSEAPRISLPPASGVQLLESRAVSRVDRFGSGETSTLTEGRFVVAVGMTGRVTLPAFIANVGGLRGASAPVTVELRRADDAQPRVVVRARLDPDRDSVFVGQQLDYVVDVELNAVARDRLRRNPTFFPPEMPGVLAYDLALPAPPRRAGPRCFETLTYRRALFPLFAGRTTIPPASLSYSLPVSTSFFSREESFELRTDSVRFRAVDPPADSRPAGYIGAVGQLTASARLADSTARMGDPVLLTLRLEAVGNVKLMPRPVLTLPWASIALGDERVTVDSTANRVRGTKEFDWLLTPRRAGQLAVPPVRYPYFDPSRASYDVAVTDSLHLAIVPASLAASDSTPSRLGIRTTMGEEHRAPLPAHPWFWALLALAPVPAAWRNLRRRGRPRARPRSASARLERLAGSPALDASLTRRILLDALAERVPALSGPAPHRSVSRTLRRAGVTDGTADRAAALLAELEIAAFAAERAAAPDLAKRALVIFRAVDAEAVRSTPSRSTSLAMILLALAVGSASVTAMPETLTHAFADGVAAYQRGDYAGAERLFARVSARAPRSSDAWANFGAAAWARGDTALASAGWQRALRLDPLDAETRQRLDVVQAPSIDAAAYVPPVSVNVVAALALALWMSGWFVLALPASRRPSGTRGLVGGTLLLGLVLLLATIELERRTSVANLGALRAARPLLAAPSTGTAALAATSTGEVGKIGAREGSWVHIAIDAERAGWVPVASVLRLDDPVN